MCVCEHLYHNKGMGLKKQFAGIGSLSFYHLGSRGSSYVVSLGERSLYQLRKLYYYMDISHIHE